MDQTFTYFVRALRNAGVNVSPAETLDAFAILERIGVENPILLKDSLSLVLAKTQEEKQRFETAFHRFFSQFAFNRPMKRAMFQNLTPTDIMEPLREFLPTKLFAAVEAALEGNRHLLSQLVEEAASQIQVREMRSLREKTTYAMQINELLEIQKFDAAFVEFDASPIHRYLRSYLLDEIKNYVDKQYKVHVDPTGKKALVEATLNSNLASIPHEYLVEVRRVVEKLGERLVKERRRHRLTNQDGTLDIKRTLRKNMAYDGSIFDLRWRQKKREVSTVYVLCDVSQSVARVARFLLLLLFELVDVLPKVRAFAFSSVLGEVTDVFQKQSSDKAIEDALFSWGKGNTDYGRALHDFRQMCGKELNRRSTIIVLGDGRSNFYDPGLNVVRELSQRCKQLYWLNPETRDQWSEGDSEMAKYAPLCTRVQLCNRIEHLERFADELIRVTR